ncbi:Flp pilus assembly protein CpaB [Trinickia caryophylli]|uniref:Pilus assembly protein CpaB n=1 Tax=Trinickia caryophylli TaxID=28094 RepID=A0A1X7G9I0_TRICW|nr:Flp pilus assembly protein CpaB [Trinickia caryophylli]PMS11384.1 Flp pilus assembly protein CpaB [Trinickia caryophylli]TRX17579.1 Flp pilus assembly protein CpaB [Trinickia caryophylli]WQE11669.1 Flp pilus assembly protein CpaB [Trinickia caryophylli]SMF66285.1 pilus assembly protein CpaB [Trinickia caryophylli]GLU34855.1 membrane fimbriae assembly protein [Trinickia caryophylli]
MPNLTRVAAGLLIAAALLLAAYAWTLSRRPAPRPPHVAPAAQASFPVVVAARRLSAGQPIEDSALRVERLAHRPQGTYVEPAALARRVPLTDIESGAPVFEAQLSSGFAEQVEPGQRAVAVHVDEASAVGDRLRPGNFVDVYVMLKRENAALAARAEVTRTQAKLLLSRLRVLAFGDTAAGGGKASERTVHPRTAVLAVPAADVERLALADSAGRVLLALRSPRDTEGADRLPGASMAAATALASPGAGTTAKDEGVSLAVLSGAQASRGREVPPRRTQVSSSVEVIRAGHPQTIEY